MIERMSASTTSIASSVRQPERKVRWRRRFRELVVFGDPFSAGRGAGLDLAAARAHGQVGDECVARFARPVRDHRAVAGLAAHPKCLKGFRHRADLVDLDEGGVADTGARLRTR